MAFEKVIAKCIASPKTAVLVDATSLNRRMKGVGRYAWHLCEALSRGLPAETELILVVFAGELPDFPAGFRGRYLPLPYCSELRLGLREFPRLIRETGAAVFVRPADKIGQRYPVPTLTVCHDVNPMIWSAQSRRTWSRQAVDWLWERLRGHALRHSQRVICNSQFIRRAAIRQFGLNPERVTIGYCGVDKRFPELAAKADLELVRQQFGTRNFVLAFATGDEREGFRILPELWSAAIAAGYQGKLVIAGIKEGAPYARDLLADFKSKALENSVAYLPFLGEERIADLAAVYGGADFYLETSRHEGFGMQLLEAMACGTTCFSSGRGALDEIGGGFPLPMDISAPKAAGKAVAAAWHAGLHKRDNTLQVAHALSFNWQNPCDEVVRFVRQNLPGPDR